MLFFRLITLFDLFIDEWKFFQNQSTNINSFIQKIS